LINLSKSFLLPLSGNSQPNSKNSLILDGLLKILYSFSSCSLVNKSFHNSSLNFFGAILEIFINHLISFQNSFFILFIFHIFSNFIFL